MRRCRFTPGDGGPWLGRYDRIPGDLSVFHLRYSPEYTGWWPFTEQRLGRDVVSYPFAASDCVKQLAATLEGFHTRQRGRIGGSFIINEWGQVIAPSQYGDRRRFFIGRLEGPWELLDPLASMSCCSLGRADALEPGDAWRLPYVGMPYHLSQGDRVYFMRREPDGDHVDRPPTECDKLVNAIRKLRGWGPVRFIVNPFGVVLTKVPSRVKTEEYWNPIFVGWLDFDTWFDMEDR